ncbi:MAG: endonuclease V [Candidatus Eisenbacteria bacterium]|nr:endonuclease V [Candidatus Eisenbacteria bacterium]
MRARMLHRWDLSPREAVATQSLLRDRIRETPLDWTRLRHVAGCDAASLGGDLIAAAVVYDLEAREIVEVASARGPAPFLYVPGLLSFREVPVLLAALSGLRTTPQAILCDGQGRAHPRGFGLACHLGLLLETPSVGVAKSRLIGDASEPAARRGSSTALLDRGETVGRVLRTRDGVRPLYVSVGHRITLEDSVRLVLRTGMGYRLPEPTRQADRLVRGLSREARARTAEPAETTSLAGPRSGRIDHSGRTDCGGAARRRGHG